MSGKHPELPKCVEETSKKKKLFNKKKNPNQKDLFCLILLMQSSPCERRVAFVFE